MSVIYQTIYDPETNLCTEPSTITQFKTIREAVAAQGQTATLETEKHARVEMFGIGIFFSTYCMIREPLGSTNKSKY